MLLIHNNLFFVSFPNFVRIIFLPRPRFQNITVQFLSNIINRIQFDSKPVCAWVTGFSNNAKHTRFQTSDGPFIFRYLASWRTTCQALKVFINKHHDDDRHHEHQQHLIM